MDLVLLKSFLEVSRLRHFGRAADRLHVTQSAMSARIKQLESELGTPLFERQRNDIRLTPAGQRLLKHAETILQGWERARQDVVLEPDIQAALAIGFPIDLWPILVRDWVIDVHRQHPNLALRLNALPQRLLVDQLIAGSLDVAILFEPPHLPDFDIIQVATIPLLLASNDPQDDVNATDKPDYVYVDWGSNFALKHGRAHPDTTARLQSNVGFIARDLLTHLGGSAYLAEQMLVDSGLEPVRDTPLIQRAAYSVYRANHPEHTLLATLSQAADTTAGQSMQTPEILL